MVDPLEGHRPDEGFHVLKDVWTQKKYLGVHSQRLSEEIDKAIQATHDAVPESRDDYRFSRPLTPFIDDTQEERLLERAMMERWNQSGMWPIPGGWSRLVAFQVPLYAAKNKASWGAIDLLGVNEAGLPVVVELKRSPRTLPDGKTQSTETPLRMVLEAASYAIALKKNWSTFRREWINHLNKLNYSDDFLEKIPIDLSDLSLVAIAPASFWIDWLPVTPKGRNQISSESWRSFTQFLNALSGKGYPTTFLSLSGHAISPTSLAVQPLDQFPPSVV